MAVLGIIGIYIIIILLFAISIKADDAATKIIAFVLVVAVILWLVIGKPAFWEGHKALKVAGEVISGLVVIMCLGDKKEDDGKDEE